MMLIPLPTAFIQANAASMPGVDADQVLRLTYTMEQAILYMDYMYACRESYHFIV
jgi:hypothetical protein